MDSYEAKQLERLKKDYEKQEGELKEQNWRRRKPSSMPPRADSVPVLLPLNGNRTPAEKSSQGPGRSPAPTRTRRPHRQTQSGSRWFPRTRPGPGTVQPRTQAHRRRMSHPGGGSDVSSCVWVRVRRRQDVLKGIRVVLVTGVPGRHVRRLGRDNPHAATDRAGRIPPRCPRRAQVRRGGSFLVSRRPPSSLGEFVILGRFCPVLMGRKAQTSDAAVSAGYLCAMTPEICG